LAAAGLDEEEDDDEEAASASPEADGDAARAGSAEEEAEELGAGGGGELGLESKIVAIRDFLEDPDQVPKEAIFTASLCEFATNAQFFHANCTRLWCFVTTRGRTGELVAEPGRYGRHLQGRSSFFFTFCFITSVIWLTVDGEFPST
jgi:hypothetical protein